jgi:hypothetical protein
MITTLPKAPLPGTVKGFSETLFFLSGLDKSLNHTVNITNVQNATHNMNLRLDAFHIFEIPADSS